MIKIYIYTWPYITCDSTEVLHTSFHPQIDLSKDLSVNQIDLSSGSNLQREFYNWQEMEFSVRKKIQVLSIFCEHSALSVSVKIQVFHILHDLQDKYYSI